MIPHFCLSGKKTHRLTVQPRPVLQLANSHILDHLFYFVPYFALMHPARMFLTFASITAVIEILTVIGIAYLANRDLPEKSTQLG